MVIIMILTTDLIGKIAEKKEKCTYFSSDYVILYKSMEVEDDLLEEYLERMKKAHESGIHIPKVLEYQLLTEFNEKKSMGIFVEERAKGNVLNVRGIVLKESQQYDFSQVITTYLNKVEQYLEELKRRSLASQETYDKFLDDFMRLHEFGLRPDPNSLNYLFDSTYGFTIIDPYFMECNQMVEKDLFRFIMNDVYGVSRPSILIKRDQIEGFYYLTPDLKHDLDQCSELINDKICCAFLKKGFHFDYILSEMEKNKNRYRTEEQAFSKEELVSKLQKQFERKMDGGKVK